MVDLYWLFFGHELERFGAYLDATPCASKKSGPDGDQQKWDGSTAPIIISGRSMRLTPTTRTLAHGISYSPRSFWNVRHRIGAHAQPALLPPIRTRQSQSGVVTGRNNRTESPQESFPYAAGAVHVNVFGSGPPPWQEFWDNGFDSV